MKSSIPDKANPLPPGIYCPVISLYKPTLRQEVDLEASYKYFAFLVKGGVTGLVLAGTTAEAVLLSHQERIDLTRVARKVVDDLGFPDLPLVAGISGQSVNESITFAEEAKEAGATFGLLLPPSYWAKAVSKDVILGFYRDVADASPLPVVIYNVRLSCCCWLRWPARSKTDTSYSFRRWPQGWISTQTSSRSWHTILTLSELN